MEQKEQRERDFQVYQGWKVPFIIKLAWTSLIIWCVVYFVKFTIPDLKVWLDK